jgi:hypothetical protein
MRPIYENTVIQIEITNACHLSCANCTRHVGHHRKPFFMEPEMVRTAIRSLEDFPGRVGIMGGEPCLHPQFLKILAIVRDEIPKDRREFWTAGFKWGLYREEILQTFNENRIAYNDHTQPNGKHQPLLVAIDEVVEDPELRRILIDNCPFQARWSASITPKGAFFCEIAASLDWLLDGPGGEPVERGWWEATPDDRWFQDQVAEYCGSCSGALPMEAKSDAKGGREHSVDVVSQGNLEKLLAAGSPKATRGDVEICRHIDEDKILKDLKTWDPRSFRPFIAHKPEDYHANSDQ